MSKPFQKLEWCIVRLGKDLNWWVEEISDPITWDTEGLGILDPKQVSYVMDLIDSMHEYGLQKDLIDEAFFKFRIDGDLGGGKIRLARVIDPETLLNPDEPLFWLPDLINDEHSAYADLLDHLTKVRVKMLNHLIDFKQRLTIDEIEDAMSEAHHSHFLEFKSIHTFHELRSLLEYVPSGFEDELGKDDVEPAEEDIDIPTGVLIEVEDEEELMQELVEKNANIKYSEDDEEGLEDEDLEDEDFDDFDEDDDGFDFEDSEDEEDSPKKTAAKKEKSSSKRAPKTSTKSTSTKSLAAPKKPSVTAKKEPAKKTAAKKVTKSKQ